MPTTAREILSPPKIPVVQRIDQIAAELRTQNRRGGDLSVLDWRERLKDTGILSMDLPVRYGGSPKRNQDMLPLYLHLGSIDLNLRDVPGIGHSRSFVDCGSPELEEIARASAENKVWTSVASTEENVGSDLRRLETKAVRSAGGYRLEGHKMAIYRLSEATHFVVLAQCEGKLGLFVCPSSSPGLILVAKECIGLKANTWGEIKLRDVFVPDSHRISPTKDGVAVFSSHFAYWRMSMTACAVGAARRALEYTAAWLAKRKAFGRILLSDPGMMRQIEHFRGQLYDTWLVLERIAVLLDEGSDASSLLALHVKASGIPEAHAIVDWCLEHLGWRGCLEECPLVAIRRDLACLRVSSGASDALLDALARRWSKQFLSSTIHPIVKDHYDWPTITPVNVEPF